MQQQLQRAGAAATSKVPRKGKSTGPTGDLPAGPVAQLTSPHSASVRALHRAAPAGSLSVPEAFLLDQRPEEKPQRDQTKKDSDQVFRRLGHGLVSFVVLESSASEQAEAEGAGAPCWRPRAPRPSSTVYAYHRRTADTGPPGRSRPGRTAQPGRPPRAPERFSPTSPWCTRRSRCPGAPLR